MAVEILRLLLALMAGCLEMMSGVVRFMMAWMDDNQKEDETNNQKLPALEDIERDEQVKRLAELEKRIKDQLKETESTTEQPKLKEEEPRVVRPRPTEEEMKAQFKTAVAAKAKAKAAAKSSGSNKVTWIPVPLCPACRSDMLLKSNRRGGSFWGCSQYFVSNCDGTRSSTDLDKAQEGPRNRARRLAREKEAEESREEARAESADL